MQNADGSLSAYTRHVGWKVMIRKSWKLSKNVNISIWPRIVKEGMYSWLIAIMYFKWHKWTSSILSSILPVSFNFLLEVCQKSLRGWTHLLLIFTKYSFLLYSSGFINSFFSVINLLKLLFCRFFHIFTQCSNTVRVMF